MSDNVLQTRQQLIQDVIAPDVRELKVRVGSLEKQVESLDKHTEQRFGALEKHMEQRFDALYQHIEQRFNIAEQRFAAFDQKNEAQFKAVLAAISESKAQAELASMRSVIALSERVAVLEAQQAQRN